MQKIILKDIRRDPYSGIGKPEHLKYDGNHSRRIDDKNRIVYSIEKIRLLLNPV